MYTLYSKKNCSNCLLSKKLLESKKLAYRELYIDDDISLDEIRKLYPESNNIKVAPIIVLDNSLIGGYNELLAKISKGSLNE